MPPFDLSPFQGVFPAAMTYFDRHGEVDYRASLEHWERLAQQGVQGLVIGGTSGEFISMTVDERIRLIELACEHFRGRLPIIAGTGHVATKLTIEMSREAQRLGADALIVILPYYSKPPAPSVVNHFRALRKATNLPIMLYNNPANTACPAFTPKQIQELVEDDVVHMVKSTMESVTPIHDLAMMVGDRMRIFYGSFLSAYEAFAGGAHGWVSGVLNVAAPDAMRMQKAIDASQLKEAFDIWKRILHIVHLYTYQKLGPAADIPIYRGILELNGVPGGYSREPFTALTPQQMDLLADELKASGWLD